MAHIADATSKALFCDITYIVSVETHRAFVHIVHPGQKLHYR